MRAEVAAFLKRSPALRSAVHKGRLARRRAQVSKQVLQYVADRRSLAGLPNEVVVRLAYNVMLDREPDELGMETFLRWLGSGEMTRLGMVAAICHSDEFARYTADRELGPSIHYGRALFVRSLPPARRILDLGGSSRYSASGAFVSFDYPYPFDELVIVELPSGDRHEHYADVKEGDEVSTHVGPVKFRYHSMVDLSDYPAGSFDLVYSGQTIEHVSESDADKVLSEVHRVLRPGGHFALDTPNGAVCRLQQAEFIDPDHEVEYTHGEMSAKLIGAGFLIERQHGINYAGSSVQSGVFDLEETARRRGVYDALEACYILAYVCSRA
jgi:SAM-dependent methyltransferase